MTKSDHLKNSANLIQEFLNSGGKITQCEPAKVKPSNRVGVKWSSIANVGRKKITVARTLNQGV
jgi:hypothetical protein